MELHGKSIIITGGAQGMCGAVVRDFAGAGATIASMDRQEALGSAVALEADQAGPGSVKFYNIEVTDRAGVDLKFKTAAHDMGGLDVLVNVAGVQRFVPLDEVEKDSFNHLFRMNVLGTMITNGVAYRLMKDNHSGNIRKFGSEAGLTSSPNNAVYGSSKGAVHTWTRFAARQWGPDGIRVNAVMPYVITPMYINYRNNLSPEDLRKHDEHTASAIPLGG